MFLLVPAYSGSAAPKAIKRLCVCSVLVMPLHMHFCAGNVLLSVYNQLVYYLEAVVNARNNARCTKARKATHGLDGQHQDVDRTLRGRVSQNDRGQG